MQDVMDVTEEMMAYLRGDRKNLEVKTCDRRRGRDGSLMNGKSFIWKMYKDCFSEGYRSAESPL